jgi:hypothetical protein
VAFFTAFLKQPAYCNADADVFITLTPVKDEPNLKKLPAPHDTYFDIMDEPKQMAESVQDTIVLVNLTGLNLSAATC